MGMRLAPDFVKYRARTSNAKAHGRFGNTRRVFHDLQAAVHIVGHAESYDDMVCRTLERLYTT